MRLSDLTLFSAQARSNSGQRQPQALEVFCFFKVSSATETKKAP
ncbi:hypothetical protein FB99_08680 [Pantoea agglomerans]|nr:hypothetical protein FB99_08680 [Pantoea agglomerans]